MKFVNLPKSPCSFLAGCVERRGISVLPSLPFWRIALSLEGIAVVRRSQRSFLYPLALGDEVNFRLTYDGPLRAASQSDTRRVDKHAIRCALSNQLIEFFLHRIDVFEKETQQLPPSDIRALVYKRGHLSFLALVRERLHLICDLDILFLRREHPGHLIRGGGDIDNRIKVLFDALRVPQDDNEVRGFPPNDKFIACLTEDDKLITGFRITTDRLLEPASSPAEENNVRLIINVEVKATKLTDENMAYLSHF